MQVVVELKYHDPISVNGRNGQFTIHKFKAADGTRFQTTEQALADKAYGLLGQVATIDFELEVRGEYTNNVIKSIQPGGQLQQGAPSGGGAPVSSGGAPTGAQQQKSRADFQRSKEEMRWTEAMSIAATLYAATPKLQEGGYANFIGLANKVESDIAAKSGAEAASSGSQAQGSSSPAGDGGGEQGAPQGAPTAQAAAEPVQTSTDDDIPF
jgi:hypothetical protein